MKAIEYNKEGKYLPDFMQDFHDQKDLFKAMHQLYKNRLQKELPAFNCVDSHIYTVDFFLWFMGLHGYKLQKIKTKGVEFFQINATIKSNKEKETKSFNDILSNSSIPLTK